MMAIASVNHARFEQRFNGFLLRLLVSDPQSGTHHVIVLGIHMDAVDRMRPPGHGPNPEVLPGLEVEAGSDLEAPATLILIVRTGAGPEPAIDRLGCLNPRYAGVGVEMAELPNLYAKSETRRSEGKVSGGGTADIQFREQDGTKPQARGDAHRRVNRRFVRLVELHWEILAEVLGAELGGDHYALCVRGDRPKGRNG
jgi:hypothetical protein